MKSESSLWTTLIYWKSEELTGEISLVRAGLGKGIFLLGMAGFSDTSLPAKMHTLIQYDWRIWDNLSSGILPMLTFGGTAIGLLFRTFIKSGGCTNKRHESNYLFHEEMYTYWGFLVFGWEFRRFWHWWGVEIVLLRFLRSVTIGKLTWFWSNRLLLLHFFLPLIFFQILRPLLLIVQIFTFAGYYKP